MSISHFGLGTVRACKETLLLCLYYNHLFPLRLYNLKAIQVFFWNCDYMDSLQASQLYIYTFDTFPRDKTLRLKITDDVS